MKPMELNISRGIKWLKPESEYVYNDMMAHMLYTEYSLLQVHILKSPLKSGDILDQVLPHSL